MTIQDLLESKYYTARNNKILAKEATEEIYKIVAYKLFNHCCSIEKQLKLGVSREKILEDFQKIFR